MPAHPYPSSSSSNIVVGSADLAYIERLLSTGEPLAMPDTPATKAISIVGKVSIEYKEAASGDEDVKVKTPVTGREYTALAAVLAAASSSDFLDMDIVITVLESSGAHIRLPRDLRNQPICLLIGLGQRGTGFYTDMAAFCKLTGAVSMGFEPGKETSYELRFKLLNNTEDVTVTIPVDDNIHAAAITIDAGTGITFEDTAV